MNRLIAGLIIFVIGLWATYSWWWFISDIIKGLFAIGMLVVGLILIGMGIRNFSAETAEMGRPGEKEKVKESSPGSSMESSSEGSMEMSLEKTREKAIQKAREKAIELKKA